MTTRLTGGHDLIVKSIKRHSLTYTVYPKYLYFIIKYLYFKHLQPFFTNSNLPS